MCDKCVHNQQQEEGDNDDVINLGRIKEESASTEDEDVDLGLNEGPEIIAHNYILLIICLIYLLITLTHILR